MFAYRFQCIYITAGVRKFLNLFTVSHLVGSALFKVCLRMVFLRLYLQIPSFRSLLHPSQSILLPRCITESYLHSDTAATVPNTPPHDVSTPPFSAPFLDDPSSLRLPHRSLNDQHYIPFRGSSSVRESHSHTWPVANPRPPQHCCLGECCDSRATFLVAGVTSLS